MADPVLVNGSPIAYDKVPVQYMVDGMRNYFEHGISPGSFGYALLCGDFMEMARRADENNAACFMDWAKWLYNHAPAGSFGSRENVKEWMKSRQRSVA